MGCAESSHEEIERSRKIELILNEQKIKRSKEVKILLLGAGESGKSTVFKQMKILDSKDKTLKEEELNSYRYIVYTNTVQQMKILIEEMKKKKYRSRFFN